MNHEIFAGKNCPISLWITGFIPHMNKSYYENVYRWCETFYPRFPSFKSEILIRIRGDRSSCNPPFTQSCEWTQPCVCVCACVGWGSVIIIKKQNNKRHKSNETWQSSPCTLPPQKKNKNKKQKQNKSKQNKKQSKAKIRWFFVQSALHSQSCEWTQPCAWVCHNYKKTKNKNKAKTQSKAKIKKLLFYFF